MEIEYILWGFLPLVASIALMVWSIQLTRKKIRIWKVVLSVIIFLALMFAALVLIQMMLGAWPTFIPHIVIGVVISILTVQQLVTSLTNKKSIQTQQSTHVSRPIF